MIFIPNPHCLWTKKSFFKYENQYKMAWKIIIFFLNQKSLEIISAKFFVSIVFH
jgi:hypothetical protein